jgi:bifunctional non-homologous end joining protein LigD
MLEYSTARAKSKNKFKCATGLCIKPMLADANKEKLVKHNTRYILQEKFDGTRGILYVRNGKVTGLISRYCDSDFADRFPDIINEVKYIKSKNYVLDGEITFFKKNGHPFFLTAAATPNTKKDYEVKYMVFDVLEVDGKNVTKLPLLKRLEILSKIIPSNLQHIKVIQTFDKQKEFPKIYKNIVARKGEGVMLKKKTSEYVHDSRKHWTKVKKEQTEDCVVCGITEGLGRRKWTFGALILGQYHKGKLVYVGNVGSGLSDENLVEFYTVIMSMKPAANPFGGTMGHVKKFINPSIVVEVKAMERNKTFTLRLPVFLRVRTDKQPKDCTF